MKTALVIGSMAMLAGCAGMSPRAPAEAATAGRWNGLLLRNGLRAPIVVELSEEARAWSGRFSLGDGSVPLERVQVSAANVHFELPGEGVFDGSIAGDSMAGSISGATTGSFTLKHQDQSSPPWTILMMGP